MEKVPDNHHLLKRGGVYYYRRRVPQHAVSAMGKTFIQKSLGTKDKKQARKLRELEDLKWSAKFDEIEASQGTLSPLPGIMTPTGPAPLAAVLAYVKRMDSIAAERSFAEPPEGDDQRQEIDRDIEIGLQSLEHNDDPNGSAWIERVTTRIRGETEQTGGHLSESTELDQLARRALIEMSKRRLGRLRHQNDKTFYDPLFDPARPASATFGEIASRYLAEQKEKALINHASEKWVAKIDSHVRVVTEIVGPGTLVSAVTYDICMGFRSTIAKLPANRSKLYPKLPIAEAIHKAAMDKRKGLSAITQREYVEAFKAILRLAKLQGLLNFNPAETLQPLIKDTVSAGNKRKPFSLEQIAQFFNSDFYKSCAPGSTAPYGKPDRPWRFWLPLICLFMGMRPNEVCQLLVADLKRTNSNVWYLSVTATADEDGEPSEMPSKTIKTATSKRSIPVHPELLATGLVQFVEQRRKEDGSNGRLFPSLKPNKYGNLASYPMKRFRDSFLPEAITLHPRQTFYSFRHSFRDALRRCEAPPSTLQAIGGWSQGSLTSDDYGDKNDPDLQKKWIDQVSFGQLDLSFLHIIEGDSVP